MEYREVSREKQKLHEIVNETKINLEERVNQVAKLDKELKDQKRSLKEKTRTLEEVFIMSTTVFVKFYMPKKWQTLMLTYFTSRILWLRAK